MPTKVKHPSYHICPDPCASCPYRRDVPSGVWAREEYEKLPEWDDKYVRGIFLCHNGPSNIEKNTLLCRGWFEVHGDNLSVISFKVNWNEANSNPTKVPLYPSGAAAMRAGIRRLLKPSVAAEAVMKKIARKKRKEMGRV